MTKILTIITILVFLTSCGKNQDDSKQTFKCDTNTDNILSGIRVGDKIDSENLKYIFDTIKPSIYSSGTYYNENYNFNQYNTDTLEWCYYYSIDVNKNKEVTSVYLGE